MDNIKVNQKYKDRLFRFIFGNEELKENTLSLYNALNNSHYSDIADLEFTTIEDVIYMGMKNDVSFIVGFDMPLYEHQSTFNPNMPVRGLMYYGRLYDQYIATHHCNRYGKKLVKLPTPSNIVFYNGVDEVDDVVKLKLSDAFYNKEAGVEYEWTVTMVNINSDHNKNLKSNCKALRDYSILIDLIRAYVPIYGKEEGILKAVEECIERNILSEILIKHKAEVIGMCLTEYRETEQIQLEREEAMAEGREEGREEGRKQGIKEGREEGIKEGRETEIFQSVFEEDYSFERAAQKLGISLDEFKVSYESWLVHNK